MFMHHLCLHDDCTVFIGFKLSEEIHRVRFTNSRDSSGYENKGKYGYYLNRLPAPHFAKCPNDIWIQIHF